MFLEWAAFVPRAGHRQIRSHVDVATRRGRWLVARVPYSRNALTALQWAAAWNTTSTPAITSGARSLTQPTSCTATVCRSVGAPCFGTRADRAAGSQGISRRRQSEARAGAGPNACDYDSRPHSTTTHDRCLAGTTTAHVTVCQVTWVTEKPRLFRHCGCSTCSESSPCSSTDRAAFLPAHILCVSVQTAARLRLSSVSAATRNPSAFHPKSAPASNASR